MLKNTIFIIVSCSLIAGIQANACYAKIIRLAYVNFPPYEFENNGKPDGILVLIIQEVFEKAGIKLELKPFPFKRAYEYVKKGSDQTDGLFNFYKVKERIPFFDYSDPIIKNHLVFFIRKNMAFQYTGINDLKGLKIGVIRGYTYGTEFDENPDIIKSIANSHLINFKKLAAGRIDVYPCDKLVGLHVAFKAKLMPDLVAYHTPMKIMDGHIGFTKDRHQDTIRRINQVISTMQQNGEIEAIVNQFINNRLFVE